MWALGLACGIVAAWPMVSLLRRGQKDMVRGFASVIFAFAFIQGALLVLHVVSPQDLVPFGVLGVLAFLALVTVSALRHG